MPVESKRRFFEFVNVLNVVQCISEITSSRCADFWIPARFRELFRIETSMSVATQLTRALASFLAGPPLSRSAAAVVVSVGNDAGDLDSLVSAIAYAEWQQAATPEAAEVLFVPLAPFKRRDFRLRTDATLLFEHCGVPLDADTGAPASLLHLDEAAAPAAAGEGRLGITLTDHNACVPAVAAALGDRIIAIVDHHNDERRHLVDADEPTACKPAAAVGLAAVRSVREVDPSTGSACSLMAELMSDAELARCSEGTRLLMLGTIAIDTRGFAPALIFQKFGPRDVRAVQRLCASLQADATTAPAPLLPLDADKGTVAVAAAVLAAAPLPASARVRGATTYDARLIAYDGLSYGLPHQVRGARARTMLD
jgi:hypothetical protein